MKRIVTGKIKRWLLVALGLLFLFFLYVQYVNRNTEHMTGRQKILKAIYPVLMGLNRLTGTQTHILHPENAITPPVSFYTLSAMQTDGAPFLFSNLRGKKVLLVNTASDCGYTGQYSELQQLQQQMGKKLVILGFPANDFKEQEKGTDADIAAFCQKNYGVSFQLMQKSRVVKGPQQNSVFAWLTNQQLNGWNSQAPAWNFAKYLVDENGNLTHYFGPGVSPLGKEVLRALQ